MSIIDFYKISVERVKARNAEMEDIMNWIYELN